MSTNKMNSKGFTPKYARKCAEIIGRFNDSSMPISTWDFKNMLFYSLHDAYMKHEQTMVTEDHVTTIYFLWEILEEIEQLNNEK